MQRKKPKVLKVTNLQVEPVHRKQLYNAINIFWSLLKLLPTQHVLFTTHLDITRTGANLKRASKYKKVPYINFQEAAKM